MMDDKVECLEKQLTAALETLEWISRSNSKVDFDTWKKAYNTLKDVKKMSSKTTYTIDKSYDDSEVIGEFIKDGERHKIYCLLDNKNNIGLTTEELFEAINRL